MFRAYELKTLAVDASFIAVRLAENLETFGTFRFDTRAERSLRFCFGEAAINVPRGAGHRHLVATKNAEHLRNLINCTMCFPIQRLGAIRECS